MGLRNPADAARLTRLAAHAAAQAKPAPVRPLAPHVASATRQAPAAPASRTAQASPAPVRHLAPHVASAVRQVPTAPVARTAQASPAPAHRVAPHGVPAMRPAPAAPGPRTVQASPAPVRCVAPHVASSLRPGPAGGQATVQGKMKFGSGTDYLNIDGAGAGITLKGYRETLREAIDMSREVAVQEGIPPVGTAMYTPDSVEWTGTITIRPLPLSDLQNKTEAYNSRLIAMAHETRHAIDDLTKLVRYRNDKEERIHTEWRAFATQSAVAWELAEGNEPVEDRYKLDIASFESRQAFMASNSRMVGTTQSYMMLYGMNSSPSVSDVQAFMLRHQDWVDEAVALFNQLRPQQVSPSVARNLRPSEVNEGTWDSRLRAAGWTILAVGTALVLNELAKHYGLR